ncbi:MAG: class I SAM-dependent DNA methyltransferase, partial [Candidatus Hodarchaeota archaeon]
MIKPEISTEKEVLEILKKVVDEIQSLTKSINYKELEQPLGFFFARVLDNKITRSAKNGHEYESAIKRAAAFLIVIQIILYILFSSNKEINKYDIELCESLNDFQLYLDELVPNQQSNIILSTRIVELLPENSIIILKRVFKILLELQIENIKGDILGRIFHSLIPFNLRKFLAAFYTSNIAGDFLARLAVKEVEAKILDPACGSGTLLVSAYNRLKELDEHLTHSRILEILYGVDISVFAAQLAVINLFLKNPKDRLQNSQITIQDAFKIKTGSISKGESNGIPLFNLVLGNPPFTRGDRLDSEYKDFLEKHFHMHGIYFNYNKKYLGLYAYFLIDSLRLLRKDGIIAYILPISTINSSTMKPVIKFLLEKTSFQYLITSDAQIAFSEQSAFKEILLIAHKGKNPGHKVKFVVLKNELSKQNYINFVKKIEETSADYEDCSIRINIILEELLYQTLGLNWVIYFYNRNFYNIFERIRHSSIVSPVSEIVRTPRYDVDRGLRAGLSNFFYLPNKFWVIQEEHSTWIKIKNKENNLTLKIPQDYIIRVLRKSSYYNQIIPAVSEFILIFPPQLPSNGHIESYIRWGMRKFGKKIGFEKLTYEHIRKGRKLAHTGVIHELSLDNNKIIAYYYPKPICLSDNFIFIRTFN